MANKVDIADNDAHLNIVELAEILSRQIEYGEIARFVSQKAVSTLGAEVALILMINPQTRHTVKTIFRQGYEIEHPRYRAVQNLISGWIMKHKEAFCCADIRKDPQFKQLKLNNLDIKSVLGVPFRMENSIFGTIILFRKKSDPSYREHHKNTLEQIALIAAPYVRNVQKIQQYFEAPMHKTALLDKYKKLGLLGKSRRFIEMLQAIEAASRCDVRVLLEGSSGTGKELVAKAIHILSARSSGPFIALDCGAIPTNLLESELFGHVKGAFTGANYDRMGLLEEANGGTLFMDEIVNLPLDMQSKLMRVLQEGEIRPVGSNKARKVDVRIISAASVSLQKMIEKQLFREDLFYRLYVYPILIPSLDARSEDIPTLANHFLKKYAKQQNKKAELFHADMLHYLKNRNWHGNVRELENIVERLVTLATVDMVELNHEILPRDLLKEFKEMKFEIEDHDVPRSLSESIDEYEKDLIRQALIRHNWNQAKAARALKIPKQTIGYKMQKLGIKKPESD